MREWLERLIWRMERLERAVERDEPEACAWAAFITLTAISVAVMLIVAALLLVW